MDNTQWKFKVGGRAQGLIPSLIMLTLFGGVTIYLYTIHHGAFLFGLLLTIIMLVLTFLTIFRGIFVKLLIGEEGFYHQTKPGNGRYYKYSEIEEAWQSEGKELNGTTGLFCSYRTCTGNTVKFPFFPFEADGIEYFIERVQKDGGKTVLIGMEDKPKEYIIDGKIYGKTSIVATLVLLILFLALTIPAILQINQTSYPALASKGIVYFTGSGALLIAVILVLLIIRYYCFKVQIGSTGFYLRTTPFNGRHYSYSDIISCRIEQKVYRHRHHISNPGANKRLYYHYFVFTDKNGNTNKFQFQQSICGHEIEVLKERIELAKQI